MTKKHAKVRPVVYSPLIQKALALALDTHEVKQKQKRKGKDIPYIVHPLTVGLILAKAGAPEEVVAAGLLHDTMEDSAPDYKVTLEDLTEAFGDRVTSLVESVTEARKDLSWEERKQEALEHIKTFSHDSLLLKSADLIANVSEIVSDYQTAGDEVFTRFNAPKNQVIIKYLNAVDAIRERWPENPLAQDLRSVALGLHRISGLYYMQKYPATIIAYADYREDMLLCCPVCSWEGIPDDAAKEYYHTVMDASCPICDKMLLVVEYPAAR